jgi:hypothetical protein
LKHPTSNIQHPEKFQAPNIHPRGTALAWSLEFEVSLELGAWSLEFCRATPGGLKKENPVIRAG